MPLRSRRDLLLHWTFRLAALLRGVLCWAFALGALVFLRTSVSTLSNILHPSHAARGAWWRIAGTAVGLLLPVLAVVFGMAWWTVWRQKASARGWAIAASLANVLFGCLELYLMRRITSPADVLLLAMGVIGLVVFSPRNLAAKLAEKTPVQPPIPGDGTNALIDKMIWIFALAGFAVGFGWWERWARAQGLAVHFGLLYFLESLVAALVIIVVHELGHALAGKTLGMKLRAFIVGPFQWRISDGKWEFRFLPAKIFATGGATAVVPTTLEHFRAQQICMIAAGPFASLVGGLIAFCAALAATNSHWEPAWLLLALIATLSLLGFIVNLIPFRTETSYSDGAQIYQLLSKGPWGDYHRALSIAGSTLVTPLRPRDFDIEAIQRAAVCITHGPQGLLLRLLASSYYLDCGRIPEASQALAEAEGVYKESASEISAELDTVFVFGKAFLQRDSAGARRWWERMEAKKPSRFNGDYWMARSALLWRENRLEEAQEAWQKGYVLAQQLPKAGAYESDRDRFALLRKALDESLSAHLAQDLPATTG